MEKKYTLKKRVKFQGAAGLESEKYYNSLQRINRLKVRKVILKRYKTDDLREALWKASWHTYWRKYWAKEGAKKGSLGRVCSSWLFFMFCFWR